MLTVDQEIVRLSIDAMAEGIVFCREWSFCSDHTVYTRVTNLDTQECPLGWQASLGWEDLEQLQQLVKRMVNKGWRAIWNPMYTAAAEFSRFVSLS